MIYLYTDFGSRDIYLGQLKAALQQRAPGVAVIDLCNDLPDYELLHSAHLLAALAGRLEDPDAVLLCVVDPGVGGSRRPLVMQADGRWLVGPDNGLLSVVASRTKACRSWEILWRPKELSRSFHGRDLFAPVAAMLASGTLPPDALREIGDAWQCEEVGDLAEIIHVDHYGNALTGLRSTSVPADCRIEVAGRTLSRVGTFSEAEPGSAFWYENSLGLVEVAVNQGSAALQLQLRPGTSISVLR